MNRNHYVYLITNKVNGMKYIGKRSCLCPIEQDRYMGSGTLISKALKKYGRDNFSKEILFVGKTEEEAYQCERELIERYDAVKSREFYNIKEGGLGNTREDALRNLSNLTEEQKRIRSVKLSIANKGENNAMYGRTGELSPVSKPVVMMSAEGEMIKRFSCIREVNDYFGKPRAFSFISRVCLNKKGTAYGHLFLFEEDYQNMINNNTFKEWLEDKKRRKSANVALLRQKSAESNKKPVYQMIQKTLDIVGQYDSVREASVSTGILAQSISRNCRHGCNTAGGYSWIFVDEYNTLSKEELVRLYSHKPNIVEFDRSYAKKPVYCITTGVEFESVKDAVKHYGMCRGAKIHEACDGRRKTCGKHPVTKEGLEWRYA